MNYFMRIPAGTMLMITLLGVIVLFGEVIACSALKCMAIRNNAHIHSIAFFLVWEFTFILRNSCNTCDEQNL